MGRQAVGLAAAGRPSLVMLDVGLPVLDGYQAAATPRTRYGQGPRILAITADGWAAERSRRMGWSCLPRKPFNLADFLASVEPTITGR